MVGTTDGGTVVASGVDVAAGDACAGAVGLFRRERIDGGAAVLAMRLGIGVTVGMAVSVAIRVLVEIVPPVGGTD